MTFTEKFNPVIWVTLAYIGLYYAFLVNVLRAKLSASKSCRSQGIKFDRYSSSDPKLRAADRIQLNTLEHMPAFLILLWLHAAIVDPAQAGLLGWGYVGLRALYPIFLGSELERNIPMRLLLNTFSAYLIMACMSGSILYRLM